MKADDLENKEYITLKEAAKISGYSADYVGQLIRKGKLPGRQVYTNIAWVTTEDAIRQYLAREKGKDAIPSLESGILPDYTPRWYERAIGSPGVQQLVRYTLFTLLLVSIITLFFVILAWYGTFSQILTRRSPLHIDPIIAYSADRAQQVFPYAQ